MSDEILDIAHDDPRLAYAIRRMLTELAEQGSGKIREMARDVLGGASLRQIAASSVYGDEIGASIDAFWATIQEMSPSERADLESAAKEKFAEIYEKRGP